MPYSRAVITHDPICRELEAIWHRDIPLSAAIGIGVEGYDGSTLTVHAPLMPNRNLNGTTFAGSLYSACALTGWGTIWLALQQRGLDAMIVVAESSIVYHKGVAADFICRCTLDAATFEAGLEQFQANSRASFEVVCTIDQADRRAVTFTGRYAIRERRAVKR